MMRGGGPGGMGGPGMGLGRGPRPPVSKEDVKDFKFEDMKFTFPILKKFKWSLVAALFWNIFTAAIAIIPPLILEIIVNSLYPAPIQSAASATFQKIIYYGLFLIVLYIGTYFANYEQNWVTNLVGQKIVKELRQMVFRKFIGFPMEFYTESKRGELLSIVTNDVGTLSSDLTSALSVLLLIYSR